MSVKIVLPKNRDGKPFIGINTHVYLQDGVELSDITDLKLNVLPNELTTVTITVLVSEITISEDEV